MEIYLRQKTSKKTEFKFASLPEFINVEQSARYQSYDILNIGAVQFPKGTEVGTISWDGTFFGKAKSKETSIVDKSNWKSPKSCRKILERWRDSGTVLTLVVGKTGINYDVTISSFSGVYSGAFGNFDYSISFTRCKELKIRTTNELKIKSFASKSNRSSKSNEGTYMVVSSDSLWKIAAVMLGQGNRWSEIYSLNKSVIETSAKKHGKSSSSNGQWIYPGDIYSLPKT